MYKTNTSVALAATAAKRWVVEYKTLLDKAGVAYDPQFLYGWQCRRFSTPMRAKKEWIGDPGFAVRVRMLFPALIRGGLNPFRRVAVVELRLASAIYSPKKA